MPFILIEKISFFVPLVSALFLLAYSDYDITTKLFILGTACSISSLVFFMRSNWIANVYLEERGIRSTQRTNLLIELSKTPSMTQKAAGYSSQRPADFALKRSVLRFSPVVPFFLFLFFFLCSLACFTTSLLILIIQIQLLL